MLLTNYHSLRLENLNKKLSNLNLDGFFVCNQSNITYLTGFNSRESYLLISKKNNIFITDFRYWEETKQYIKDFKFFSLKKLKEHISNTIIALSKRLKIKRLGFEANYISYATYKKIKNNLPSYTDFVPTYDVIESIREIKSDMEIDKIRKSVEINIQTFHYAKKIIKVGLKEIEIAKKLENFMKNKGGKPAFEIIVAAGANSSFPHHISSKYRLKKNDVILIDMGVDFEGYKSDLTRIFFLGKIPFIVKKIYCSVINAQKLALEIIKTQVSINKIDKSARNYIKESGWGKYFGHALGHGIGLDVHEKPYISSKNKDTIKRGMVFTIEPAVYLPKKFGIRIEDMVLFKGKEVEVLSAALDKST
ncbi:MAG: aminopeptidase P family protein [Candidatus Omnitrophica bacterium]|nr:aminopeptidase P family protein [Candidatus Omnitrophota bacterium]